MVIVLETDTETLNAILDESPFSSYLGTTVDKLGEGFAVCSIPITEKVMNSYGTLHGGVHYSLADSTVAVALLHALGRDSHIATIEGKINYVASVDADRTDRIHARATVDHIGSRTAVVSVDVMDDRNELLCKCLFTFTADSGEENGSSA